MGLIKTSKVTYKVDVPEEDIRQALIFEAAEKHGLVHEGKIIRDVSGSVTYDGRRGKGVYTVHLERDVDASGQSLLSGPK